MNALRLRFFKTTHSTDVSRETSAPETSSPKAAQAATQTPVPEVAAVPAPYHYTLSIEGMMCQHCVATVTKVLKAMDGVTDAVVDLDGQKADVSADKAISAEDFKKVITTAGYTLQNLSTPKKEEDETMEKTLKIEGMMCQHCQKHVHDALAAMDGVTAVTVDLEGKKADVTTSKDIPTEAFAKVIADAGYELVK
jgi:Cu+-exporting ATPase